MARISTYKFDENVTNDDFVIGSDTDNFNKTRNYKISEIVKSIQLGAINNIPKIISVVLDQAENIENSLSQINIEVNQDDSPVFINFLKPTISGTESINLAYKKISYFFPLGNGIYEPISDFISFEDLILNNVTSPTVNDISLLSNTEIIDAGDITGQDISQWINNSLPSLDLSDSNVFYLFTFINNGVIFYTAFNGTNGIYGQNDLQSSLLDFTEFTNSETLSFEENRNIKGKILNIEPENDFYENLEDELNEVISKVNLLPNFSVEQDEYCIIKAPFKNAQEKEYENLYLITKGKGNYGVGGFQITNTPIQILKIEDGFNSQKLSDYVNDSEFITEDDLPEITIPTQVSELSNDSNYVTQTELQNALSFRGIYGNQNQITSISNAKEGDYALLVFGKIQQKWVRNNSTWLIQSAVNFFNKIEDNYEVQITDHNATIIALNGVSEIKLDIIPYPLEFLIFNESGNNIDLLTSSQGVSISGSDELLDGQSAYVSFDDENGVYYVKKTSGEFSNKIGVYDYVNSTNNFISKARLIPFSVEIDGLGSGYKDPLTGTPDAFNTSGSFGFLFSKLKVGDVVNIEVSGRVNTTVADTTLKGSLFLSKGQSNEIEHKLDTSFFGLIDEYPFRKSIEFVVRSISSVVFTSEINFVFSQDAEISFDNVYIKILSKE